MLEPQERLGELVDCLSMQVRTAAACVRAAQEGSSKRDGAYLLEAALQALEKAEEALDADSAALMSS
jgi:hypothetical protein